MHDVNCGNSEVRMKGDDNIIVRLCLSVNNCIDIAVIVTLVESRGLVDYYFNVGLVDILVRCCHYVSHHHPSYILFCLITYQFLVHITCTMSLLLVDQI